MKKFFTISILRNVVLSHLIAEYLKKGSRNLPITIYGKQNASQDAQAALVAQKA